MKLNTLRHLAFCLLMAAAATLAAGAQTPTPALEGAVTQAPSTVPRASIANPDVQVVFNLPNPDTGYYRGTRFDWSGVIASLTYRGHQYFGQWFNKYDPHIHDAISGPVEEYVTIPDNAGLGYAAAPVGGTFVKVGVGILRKPKEDRYSFSHHYEVVQPGTWKVEHTAGSISFSQRLNDPRSGYGYSYRKTVRLDPDQPVMHIEHTLTNIGTLPIDTAVYNHNMFVVDGTASGPAMSVSFPFPVQHIAAPVAAGRGRSGLAGGRRGGRQPAPMVIHNKSLVYTKELQTGQVIHWDLGGFNHTSGDFGARIVNLKTGAGVQISGDHPLYRVVFWSIRPVLSPELYVRLHAAPGQTVTWTDTYRFFTQPPAAAASASR